MPAWKEVNSDFANYYVSSKLVVTGESLDSLYNNEWFQQKIKANGITTRGKFSPFPPVTAWMMIPLAYFPPLVAQQIFTVINLVFIGFGLLLLKRITRWSLKHCALLILGGGLSLVNNIALSQIYWIMTVFMLLGIVLLGRNQAVLAGIPMGIFSALKYFPVVFIAAGFLDGLCDKFPIRIQALSRVFKFAITSLCVLATLIALQFLYFGSDLMTEFFSSSFIPHLRGQLSGQGPYSLQFQSWDNLFRHLFILDLNFNPHPLIHWPRGKMVFKAVTTMIFSLAMAFTLYRYKNADAGKRRVVFFSLPVLTALVLLPASATYHFILLIVPISLMLGENLLDVKRMKLVLILYVMIGFIPYRLLFYLSASWGLLFAYPRLWLVTLIDLVVIEGLFNYRPRA